MAFDDSDSLRRAAESFDDWQSLVTQRLTQIHHQLRSLMSATTDLQAAQAAEAAATAKLQTDVTALLAASAAGGVSAADAAAVTAAIGTNTAAITALDAQVVAATTPAPAA